MLILGAKGHAKEVFEALKKNGVTNDIAFYDDVTPDVAKPSRNGAMVCPKHP
jgi:hypothetical protein